MDIQNGDFGKSVFKNSDFNKYLFENSDFKMSGKQTEHKK